MVILANLNQLMKAKMDEPISNVRGYVSSRITTAVARSYSHIIYRAKIPIPLQDRDLNQDLTLCHSLEQ